MDLHDIQFTFAGNGFHIICGGFYKDANLFDCFRNPGEPWGNLRRPNVTLGFRPEYKPDRIRL